LLDSEANVWFNGGMTESWVTRAAAARRERDSEAEAHRSGTYREITETERAAYAADQAAYDTDRAELN
jgi:hypothetical protein